MQTHGERVLDALTDPKNAKWVALVLLVADAVLCALIIRTTPYTEIDWRSYMQQVEQYHAGERDYTKIKGATGPLVYPAVHVYIYSALHYLTNGGQSIVLAQVIFAFLYVFNLGVVMGCYLLAEAPPYIFPMLILSKRLHSIYVLRCFNDCFAAGLLFIAILCYQRKHWTLGSIAFSLGLGVKMTLLTALPAVAVILYQALGPLDAMFQASYILQTQLLLAVPFLRVNAQGYVLRAFDFSRQFKYQWTVNWRFVSEEIFLSRGFSVGLLVLHASLLLLFITTRWLRPLGRSPKDLARFALTNPTPEGQKRVIKYISSDFVMTTMLTSIAIGLLCARSLHYQFFAYIAWITPFLLWRAKLNPLLQYIVWLGQETAWNFYPSTQSSSRIVVGVLAVLVFEIWIGTDQDPEKPALKPAQTPTKKTVPQSAAETAESPETAAADKSAAKAKKPRKTVQFEVNPETPS